MGNWTKIHLQQLQVQHSSNHIRVQIIIVKRLLNLEDPMRRDKGAQKSDVSSAEHSTLDGGQCPESKASEPPLALKSFVLSITNAITQASRVSSIGNILGVVTACNRLFPPVAVQFAIP